MKNTLLSITEPTEEYEQERFVRYCDFKRIDVFAVPNGFYVGGATREASQRAGEKLKRTGLKKGVPDLVIPVARGRYHGLFIEMKRVKSGSASAEQKQWIERLNNNGYLALVVHGSDRAINLLENYLKLKAGESINDKE